MAEAPGNLVLQFLRRFDGRVSRIAEGMHDPKVRVALLGENMAAGLSRRNDRSKARLDGIETRLGLVGV